MNIASRRRAIRLHLKLPVEYRCLSIEKENGKYNSLTENLSTHGTCVQSMAILDVGTLCNLTLALPEQQENIQVAGEVRWYDYEPSMGRMGIRFLQPINFFVSLRAVDEAVYRDIEQTSAYFGRYYQELSDACVWVNSKGEIIRYDERFLKLLGYSAPEVKRRFIYDFACNVDRERLWYLLAVNTIGASSSVSELFRMRSKDGSHLLWKIRVPLKPPWASPTEIYIEDMSEINAVADEKFQLQKMAEALKDSVSGRIVLLNADLSIADVEGLGTTMQNEDGRVSLRGMDFRKATGLVYAKVNERTLLEKLEQCARKGQAFSSDYCHYEGRAGDGPDIFPPGAFRIRISPIPNLDRKVVFLLMVVKAKFPIEIYHTKQTESTDHFRFILGAAFTGLLIMDILKEACDHFTRILGRLGILRYKLTSEKEKFYSENGYEPSEYEKEIARIEALFENLTGKFRFLVDHTYLPASAETKHFDVNGCLSRAISIASLYEDLSGGSIVFEPKPGLPEAEANEQELIIIFLVVLLICRECLRNVADRAIRCEAVENKNHIIVSMYHKGYIRQDRYMEILFEEDPLEDYFFKNGSVYFMDTLLYYCNVLSKKSKIKTRINNVPGQFRLSFLIPLKAQS